MKAAAAGVAGLAGASALAGCQIESVETPAEAPAGLAEAALPKSAQYPGIPDTPEQPPANVLKFFTPDEARTVVALTARILPGTPDDPGAREAGVVYYIDNFLSYGDGFNEPTYFEPPFAQAYEGDEPPEESEEYPVVWVKGDQIERYGFQSRLTPREVMRVGLAYVNRHANEEYGASYVDLPEEQQDAMLEDMLNGNAGGFEAFSSTSFFHVLRRYTAEGMFSDPAYGGNRGLVGWKLIGYPGAQRAYTAAEIVQVDEPPRAPRSLAQLHAFNPGQGATHPNVIEAVRGVGEEPPGDNPPWPEAPSQQGGH